jgi:hypothetical protein
VTPEILPANVVELRPQNRPPARERRRAAPAARPVGTGRQGGAEAIVGVAVSTPLQDGDELRCTVCHEVYAWGTPAGCTMWPRGCRTVVGDPRPSVCWWCCDEDQRVDLVEAGCRTAAVHLRLWTE